MSNQELAAYKKLLKDELGTLVKLAESPTRKVLILAVSCHRNNGKAVWTSSAHFSEDITRGDLEVVIRALKKSVESLEKMR